MKSGLFLIIALVLITNSSYANSIESSLAYIIHQDCVSMLVTRTIVSQLPQPGDLVSYNVYSAYVADEISVNHAGIFLGLDGDIFETTTDGTNISNIAGKIRVIRPGQKVLVTYHAPNNETLPSNNAQKKLTEVFAIYLGNDGKNVKFDQFEVPAGYLYKIRPY